MKVDQMFDLDLRKSYEASELSPQASIIKTTIKVSKAVCKTLTCICTGSCSNCK
ncbi:hypothetical protein J2W97_001822 [Paenibacillus jamilae]|jgi:hypothetical protein|uniref:Lantibiotic paenibacillin n=2 Tax=Paenibacillus polymyxa TaxID=1406 RepID=LANPA_PAEPO|nr:MULTISPECIES: FDLD family class I lanthipeptide [Paenibacillus]P86013.2 RecName: Full=Lantibiotic paenibacillin; Flags: Precursor [Paenibacillus polymyxa]AFS60100.1 PaenA [Paenibacillus polymyxa OSY-DF]AZH28151.1 lantibiotic paenibacillin [Paenibacillus sp. M-152]MBU9708418.1 FDLD family class I lanthipeptide [Paenibacillus sp. AK121]MDP9675827.1 hypothetical protein [Paenibacillus jamilae]UOD87510.1 lantibiotic paenibacillin [Paenibacillus polymyxa ATCC 842]